MHSSRLAPQARPHALADLDAVITEARKLRDRRHRALELLDPENIDAPANLRRAKAYLRLAEDRLAELQRSREVLIGGEHGRGDEEEAEAS